MSLLIDKLKLRFFMNEIETFYGLVENTLDALRIFQMCRDGRLNRVRRRLHERERRLIRSGSVFVFDEEESGIKRWTDGRLWSPSRILGNFLIYRELEKKGHRSSSHPSKPIKRPHSQLQVQQQQQQQCSKVPKILPKAAESLDMLWGMPMTHSEPSEEEDFEGGFSAGINPQELFNTSKRRGVPITPEYTNDPVLTDIPADPTSGESLRVLKSKKLSNNHKGRYVFKSNGLIKKTISIQLEGHTHHLVAYYSLEDFCRGHLQLNEALEGGLEEPSETDQQQLQQQTSQLPFDPQLMEILRQVPIPIDLMLQQNFRKPAALLASATSNAQNLLAGNSENGEKLITALEYGAINPSDLQPGKASPQQLRKAQNGNGGFVPNGGIIFSSSVTNAPMEQVQKPRPRRHSSFHPAIAHQHQFIPLIDPLNLLDESSQLSGDALDFLSHLSDETTTPDEFEYPNTTNQNSAAIQPIENDLETELFGSILSSSSPSTEQQQQALLDNSNAGITTAIRGHDVLLSDYSK